MALVDEVSGRLGDTDPFDRARKLLVADVAAYAQGRYEAVVVFDGANSVSPDKEPETSPSRACARSSPPPARRPTA